MGGEGSGRKPDPFKALMQATTQPNPNVVSNMILPNLSGVQHELKAGTHNITTDDIAEGAINKYGLPAFPKPQIKIQTSRDILYIGKDADNQDVNCYSIVSAYFTYADPRLYTDVDLDARLELWKFRESSGFQTAGGQRIKKGKRFTHPSNMSANDTIDPTYIGNNQRGAVQYNNDTTPIAVQRITEWSLIGAKNYQLFQIPYENYFKLRGFGIASWFLDPLSTPNMSAYIYAGSKRKMATLRGASIFAHAYNGQAPFGYFRIALSIKDPNGTHGERIVVSFSDIFKVWNNPHPVQYSWTSNLWFSQETTGLRAQFGGFRNP